MFKNKNGNSNNLSGRNIARIRKSLVPHISQRALADKMQLFGIDIDKNAIQRIECDSIVINHRSIIHRNQNFRKIILN